MPAPTTIDAYIATLSGPASEAVARVRAMLAEAVPEAEEAIRYGMPAARLGGQTIVHYAGWKTHLGLYPIYRGDDAYEAAIAPWRAEKDSVRFPYKPGIPWDVVERIIAACVTRARLR